MGINPYPAKSHRTHHVGPLVERFAEFEGQTVTVAGRLISFRKMGALTFGHLQDQSGRIQLYLRRDTLQPTDTAAGTLGYADLNLLDMGDLVEAKGTVTRTERGEISVLPQTLRILTKSLRPLPDKWAGLKDREAILRRRYLDTTVQPEHREPFAAVARMLYAIRTFLDERGFMEFHTPVIQPQYGGGTAKPFMTHVNALDCDMYLAISHELYLKRLIVAGFDKVYTIGRYFRNEGIDRTHHPEFSMLETMTAYENYKYNMELIEALFRHIGQSVFGKTESVVRGHTVDFGQPWERITMVEAVRRATGIDFSASQSVEEANAHLAALGIREAQPTVGEALALAFEERAGPTLIRPTLVYGHPVEISPLAKPMAVDPRYAERFEIFIAGMECGDNWTEQNDPQQLLEFWRRTNRRAAGGDIEFQPIDYDFLEALEHGMPPTTGIGPGIERMAMIFTGNENIDEVLFFPMMKPLLSPVNRAIYGVDEPESAAGEAGDVVLGEADFTLLLAQGMLQPRAAEIVLRPHLRFWGAPARSGRWRMTGSLEVEGFLPAGRLRVAGYSTETGEGPDREGESRRFADHVDRFTRLLRGKFPERTVTVVHVSCEGLAE
jgi:lysyl-tRNA synthetase class 2